MREVDLDPGVEAAFKHVTAAADRLASARIRSERIEPSYSTNRLMSTTTR